MSHRPAPTRIADLLDNGSVWRTGDIARELALSVPTVSHALRKLSALGRAHRLRHGCWRAGTPTIIQIDTPDRHGRLLSHPAPRTQTSRPENGPLARKLLDLLQTPRTLPEMAEILEHYSYEAVRWKCQELVAAGILDRRPSARARNRYLFWRPEISPAPAAPILIGPDQIRILSALSRSRYTDQAGLCRQLGLSQGRVRTLVRAGLIREITAGHHVALRLTAAGANHPDRNANANPGPDLVTCAADGRDLLPLLLRLGPTTAVDLEKLQAAGHWTSTSGLSAGLALNGALRTGLAEKTGPARKHRTWRLTREGRRYARLLATQTSPTSRASLRAAISQAPARGTRPSWRLRNTPTVGSPTHPNDVRVH